MKYKNESNEVKNFKEGESWFTVKPGETVKVSGIIVEHGMVAVGSKVVVEPQKDNFDLNNDGKVDDKDVSLAAKTMVHARDKNKQKKKAVKKTTKKK